MAKSAQEPEPAEVIEEALELLDRTLDRVKVLYEQYFLGIQKQPPTHLHNDTERKIRDLSQLQIRNTALRYRFATIQQKYGSYNSYWRRTLRQIENGTYVRQLQKVGRNSVRTGAAVPEEILAQMPKRMREQVKRDRENAVAQVARRDAAVAAGEEPAPEDDLAWIREPTELRRKAVAQERPQRIETSDADMDLEAFFAEVARRPTDPPPMSKAPAKPSGLAGVAAIPKASPAVPPKPKSAVPTMPMPAVPSAPLAAVPSAPLRVQVSAPVPKEVAHMPSQQTRPNPIAPGASGKTAVPVATMSGPFPRAKAPPIPPPIPPPPRLATTAKMPPLDKPVAPPPGMTDADVNTLYAKYVKAKEMVGEKAGPGSYTKLMKTINDQAPKIMEQYKAKGVDFSVVVKDNQVIIKAKPKL